MSNRVFRGLRRWYQNGGRWVWRPVCWLLGHQPQHTAYRDPPDYCWRCERVWEDE